MHRCSESIGTIAAALAKAQAELANPEKSLVATIRSPFPREGDRTFRYAPLSSGLDIVRKGLGRHEIATIQTTAIDQDAGLLRLTTVLAHSSGEWISSEWPVCAIADIASAQRMGAALTYARRYALFTLVGIAGEDDLDAPDICVPAPLTGESTIESSTSGLRLPPQTRENSKIRGAAKTASPTILLTNESAALRDRLLSEIAGLASQDSATTWAGEALPAKNTLTAGDANFLEDAFEQKLSQLLASAVETIEPPVIKAPPAPVEGSEGIDTGNTANQLQPKGIDKSLLAVSAPRRYRNKEHLRYVTLQPCLLCARKPPDAHHLRFVQPRALGRKASDEFAVPLCRIHRRLIAPAMSGPGGRPPASIRSRLRASFGRTRVQIRAWRGRIRHCKPLGPIDHSLPRVSTAKHHNNGLSPCPSLPGRIFVSRPQRHRLRRSRYRRSS
jgi:ERF superfamily